MKVLTIMGTRPEFIRLSEIIKKVDKFFEHIIVHTGQSFDFEMNEVFFRELNLRKPDYFLNAKSDTPFGQISIILEKIEKILLKEMPDSVLILGDTNSGLSALVAKRMGIPVFHLEAGNRCYDDRVPEEVNRKVIDSCSGFLLPYTQRSREQLLLEGYHPSKIFVVGNPIGEIIRKYKDIAEESDILNKLEINDKKYILVTIHREENVDDPKILLNLCESLSKISKKYKVIVSTHPRTRKKIDNLKLMENDNLKFMKPFGFIDFLKLEMEAFCILTDSGTVQEEAVILSKPCVLMRSSTERPELIESGGIIMTGVDKNNILEGFEIVTHLNSDKLIIPVEYREDISDKIVKILLRKIKNVQQ